MKAIKEPKFSQMYTRLCLKLAERFQVDPAVLNSSKQEVQQQFDAKTETASVSIYYT